MKLARLPTGDPEIFHTLQGEGLSVGMPAVFIRTSRCNLHCVWCDTDHTWNFEGTPWPHEKDRTPGYRKHNREAVTIDLSPHEIAAIATAFGCHRFVLTGGEPLLQQDDLLALILELRATLPGAIIEVETNGTLAPTPELHHAIDQFNISPKLANSQVADTLRVKPDALACFAVSPKASFKFVTATPADLQEILALSAAHGIPREKILLMPAGRTRAELDARAPWLAEQCRDHHLRYSDRLHIRLWNDEPAR